MNYEHHYLGKDRYTKRHFEELTLELKRLLRLKHQQTFRQRRLRLKPKVQPSGWN